MRPFRCPPISDAKSIQAALAEIERASYAERMVTVAQAFTVSNVTETRTLDASTATLADLRNFVGTLVLDMQRGGQKGQ